MKPKKTTIDQREQAKAVKELIDSIASGIESNGGKVLDFGFHVPPPTRPATYRKHGKIKKTKGVSALPAAFIAAEIMDIVDPIPF